MDNFEYYKFDECFSTAFYMLPQELFKIDYYNNFLNSDSKILYSLLLNRFSLSRKNHWVDENGNIYAIYSRKDAAKHLGVSEKTITNAFKNLKNANLIKERKQGRGLANLIYVGKINHNLINTDTNNNNLKNENDESVILGEKNCHSNENNLQVLKSDDYNSIDVKNTFLEPKNLQANNININKTKNNNNNNNKDNNYTEIINNLIEKKLKRNKK